MKAGFSVNNCEALQRAHPFATNTRIVSKLAIITWKKRLGGTVGSLSTPEIIMSKIDSQTAWWNNTTNHCIKSVRNSYLKHQTRFEFCSSPKP